MAERGYLFVQSVPIFKNQSLSAGDAATSDPINVGMIAQNGFFSLYYRMAVGTAGTMGTTVFSYVGAAAQDGNFIAPQNAVAIGTAGTGAAGTGGTNNIATFQPELMPWMKVIATQTGAGTAGKDSKIVEANLLVQ